MPFARRSRCRSSKLQPRSKRSEASIPGGLTFVLGEVVAESFAHTLVEEDIPGRTARPAKDGRFAQDIRIFDDHAVPGTHKVSITDTIALSSRRWLESYTVTAVLLLGVIINIDQPHQGVQFSNQKAPLDLPEVIFSPTLKMTNPRSSNT